MLPFENDLDVQAVHVRAPTQVIFLCGGQRSAPGILAPLSLRDAFLKILDNPILKNRELLLAEDITKLSFFSDYYEDLLQFETELAQITELILLFCESEGSLAELGAFTTNAEIAVRLLVIIRDKHWVSDSFVKLGPLRYLQNRHGSSAICVLDDLDLDIRENSTEHVKIDVLKERLQKPLQDRLEKDSEPTTFDERRAGHVIKLIVGLIQEYGALKVEEIQRLLALLNVERTSKDIGAYLLCATSAKWVISMRKGQSDYFFARDIPDAASEYFKKDAKIRNKARRRLMIREHWAKNDPDRDRGIKQILADSV